MCNKCNNYVLYFVLTSFSVYRLLSYRLRIVIPLTVPPGPVTDKCDPVMIGFDE